MFAFHYQQPNGVLTRLPIIVTQYGGSSHDLERPRQTKRQVRFSRSSQINDTLLGKRPQALHNTKTDPSFVLQKHTSTSTMKTILPSLLASFVLLATNHIYPSATTVMVQAQGEEDDDGLKIIGWYTECFFGEDNVTKMILCTLEESECFARDTVDTIETCVAEKVGLLDEPNFEQVLENLANLTAWIDFGGDVIEYTAGVVTAVGECLVPYITCLSENIEEWVSALPPCVNETLTDLFLCGLENNATCTESCSGDLLPEEENPFADLDPFSLATCSGVQDEIFTPMCQVVDCCEPCVDEFEAAARCVMHDILAYPETRLFQPNNPCISCDYAVNTRSRQLMLWGTADNTEEENRKTPTPRRHLTEAEQANVDMVIERCIDNTPGLTPNARDADELVQRGGWFTCVTDGFFDVVEDAAAVATDRPTPSPTSAARAVFTAPMPMIAFLGRIVSSLMVAAVCEF